MRRLSGTSSSKTQRVAIAACAADSGKPTLILVAAADDPAGLGEPDLALGVLDHRLRPARAHPVGVDVVVQPPVARHVARAEVLLEGVDPAGHVGHVQHLGGQDGALGALAPHRAVVGRDELRAVAGRLAAVVGLVPGGERGHPRIARAELAEVVLEALGRRQLAPVHARVAEADQRRDAGGLRLVEPRVDLLALPRMLHRIPRHRQARARHAELRRRRGSLNMSGFWSAMPTTSALADAGSISPAATSATSRRTRPRRLTVRGVAPRSAPCPHGSTAASSSRAGPAARCPGFSSLCSTPGGRTAQSPGPTSRHSPATRKRPRPAVKK